MYKFDQWLNESYPGMLDEYKQDYDKSFLNWINKHPEIIQEWELFINEMN